MTKGEVKKALDSIRDMSDEEIRINTNYIRQVAEGALCLIQQWDGIVCKKRAKRRAIFNNEGR